MNAQPIVIGMVGAGFAASFHVENYRRVPGLNIRIKGVDLEAPRKRGRPLPSNTALRRFYSSVEALLADPEITLVDLCVPNHRHLPLTLQAAEASKHIVCEKPLTGYFGDGGENARGDERRPGGRCSMPRSRPPAKMVDAVKRNGVTFCYGENWVYAPSVQKANDILTQSDNTILRIVRRGVPTAARIRRTRRSGVTLVEVAFSIRDAIQSAVRST